MADVFLSYNREDQAVARRFAAAFQHHGFDVWWDATLRSGEAYDQVTEKALRDAKAVVVLWSKKSVESRWVRAEATVANRNKTLVPAMIEPCERPIMFELTQTAELFHWHGDVADRAWLAFVGDVRRFVEARAAIRQAFDDPANQDATRSAALTAWADHHGDTDLVLACLRRSLIDRNGVTFVSLYHPFETEVRTDPRFKEIVRELGLVDYWRASGNWGEFARPLGADDFECW